MTQDHRQLQTILRRFRTQHALEVGTRGLFYGGLAAGAVILYDKIAPFPTTWDPGYLALGAGLLLGGLAGTLALLKRYRLEDAARAVDAHFALQEQLGSAQELAHSPGEFESALNSAAATLVASENFTRDFRLRPPRYARQAGASIVAAGLLLFVPPLQSLNPATRTEMAELKARETTLRELSQELKEIKKDDQELEQLAREVEDLAIRSQKNRLTKEDFLRELDDIQKQLESRMADLDKEGVAKALDSLKDSMSELNIPEVAEAKDLQEAMEALQKKLDAKSLKFDQLDALEKTLKDQQAQIAEHPELDSLKKELGKLREEALKQETEKLGGEVGRLLEEMKKEAESGAKKTPAGLKEELQNQVEQMQQEAKQGELGTQDTQEMQSKIEQQRPTDPASANKMQQLNEKLSQALSKQQQLGKDGVAQQQQNQEQAQQQQNQEQGQQQPGQQGQEGEQGQPKEGQEGQQGSQPGEQSQQGESAGQNQSGEGEQGQNGQSPSQQPGQNPSSGGQGQQAVQEWIKQQQQGNGAAGGQGEQPMSGAPQLGPQSEGNQQGQGSGQGQSSGFSAMSKQEMRDWADMLKQYQGLESSSNKVGQARGGGQPGEGRSNGGGSGWGLGHNPGGAPSDQGSGQAPNQPGMQTQQNKQSLDQLLDFQALYDPHLINAKTREDLKINGQMLEGESGGFTMVKAPHTEEGDAVTPYFMVDPKTAEAEVQALEDQEIPANLKDLVRSYFESLDR